MGAEIWMDVDAALSEVPVNMLPLLDATDFKTIEADVNYNAAGLTLIWHFVTTAGAYSQTAVTPTDTGGNYDWVEQGNGLFTIEIPASGGATINNATEGFGWFTGVATGVLPWRGPVIGFRAAGLNNAMIDSAYSATRGLAGTALPDAAADAAGGLPISDAGALDLDLQIKTDIDAILEDTGTTLDDLVDDLESRLTAARAGYLDNLQYLPAVAAGAAGGLFIAGANAATSVTTALTANITGNLSGSVGSVTGNVAGTVAGIAGTLTTIDALWAKIQKWLRLALRKDAAAAADHATELAEINANGGSGAGAYVSTTDAQEALRDRGDAAWITATGFAVAGNQMDLVNAPNATAITAIQNGLATPTNITAGTISTVTNLTNAPTVGDLTATMKASVNAEMVDALATDIIADSIPADGTRPTIAQAAYMLVQFMLERAVVGTTVTVKKADGVTSLFTLTLDSATAPTTITRAS